MMYSTAALAAIGTDYVEYTIPLLLLLLLLLTGHCLVVFFLPVG
jgi:hypothetical protein